MTRTARGSPTSLPEAARLLQREQGGARGFRPTVVDHYLNAARVELDAYNRRRHRLGALPWLRTPLSPGARPAAPDRACRRMSKGRGSARGTSRPPSSPTATCAAVVRAGGCPVLVPLPSPCRRSPTRSWRRIDGARAHRRPGRRPGTPTAPSRTTRRTSPGRERDAWEISPLPGRARARDLPLLAICRGLQVLNVSMGGTLHQHLPDVVGHDTHRVALGQIAAQPGGPRTGSRVAALLGPETEGRCHHHQAVDRLGDRVVARRFCRRRHGGGGRGPGPGLRPRRAVAPRGQPGRRPPVRGAGRGGPHCRAGKSRAARPGAAG